MNAEDLGLLFFTALLLSLLLTPMSITFAKYIGAVDVPIMGRSVHLQSMTRLGGLGIAFSVLISLALFLAWDMYFMGFFLGAVLIVVTGILDDLFQMSPAKKMLGQILACITFLLVTDLSLHSFGDLLALGDIHLSTIWAWCITLFCMLGIVNAFNLSDGLDGLASGLTIIASLFLGALAFASQNWIAVAVVVAILGSVLGFLKFNTYPAKLFMGDTGSLMLGFFMACLIVYLPEFDGAIAIQPITMAIILAVPIIDTLLVMTRRILKGKSPASADKTHLHHRLLSLGISHASAVTIIYGTAFLFGFLAIFMRGQAEWLQLLLALSICFVLYMGLALYETFYAPVKSTEIDSDSDSDWVKKVTSIVGKSLKSLRFFIFLGLLIPICFIQSTALDMHGLVLSVLALLLVLFPWKEHHERLGIVYALFYLAALTILYVLNVSTFKGLNIFLYTSCFVITLCVWSALKIRFKGHKEVFLTSGFELLLILISWFVPYIFLPVLNVPNEIIDVVKISCLQAIPLLIALKIVIRRQPDRNYYLVFGFASLLSLILLVI
ncbi:MAG: MraY family glycosyltransferase [Mariprofundaceae bacterium]|nr:MraY family glycosyltransferase [Mariprofundaceae bacterium]